MSALVGAGGHIVYLGVDDQGQLQLIGLDPSNGHVAWHRPSAAATHVPGVEQQVVANNDTVFNVEASGTGNPKVAFPAQAASAFDVVAVDARTGNDRWHHPFDSVRTPLDKCGDGLCVQFDARGQLDITRLNFATGNVLSEGVEAFEPLVAEDGELAISASRTLDDVVLTSGYGKQIVWEHVHSVLFGSADVTPDGGWSGLHLNGLWIVWLGARQSLGATSGISDDGRMLWTTADTAPCFILTGDPLTAPVLCGHEDFANRTLTLGTIQGIDPSNGKAVWTLDAGAIDPAHLGASVVRLDSTHFALHVDSGDVGLDLATGPSGPPSTTDGWCETFGDFTQVEGQRSIVATSWAPCTLGKGPDTTTPKVVPDFAGPTVSGFGAWVENGEVRAAKVS